MSATHSSSAPTERGVGYWRKSNEDDGCSIEQQQKWGHATCEAERVELVREFSDQAKKGHETAKRVAFLAMLAFCQAEFRAGRPISVVVCWNANRFSRSDSTETNWFIWEFRKAGVSRMLTASGWVDFGRMEDRMLFNVTQDADRHQFVQQLARDVSRGAIAAASEGRWMGGKVPYGYRPEYKEVVRKGRRKWVVDRLIRADPAEVETLQWIFDTYANDPDSSLRSIAEALNDRGIPATQRAPAWGYTTISKILSHPVYLGAIVWNRRHAGKFCAIVDCEVRALKGAAKTKQNAPDQWIRREGRHEALVPLETWERVQLRLASNRTRTCRKGSHCFVFSGLLVCGHCGYRMIGRTFVVKGKAYHYYTCGGYNAFGKAVCNRNAIEEETFQGEALDQVQEWLSDGRLTQLRAEMVALSKQADAGTQRREATRGQLRAKERQCDEAARRLLTEDKVLLPLLRKQLLQLHDERDRLAKELAKADGQQAAGVKRVDLADAAILAAKKLRISLASKSPQEVREALQGALSSVELYFEQVPSGKRSRAHWVRALLCPRPDTALGQLTELSNTDGSDAQECKFKLRQPA